MAKQTGKVNIAMVAASVLLCLTLFTTHLTSGMYARYTTGSSVSDGARVAKFTVTANDNGSVNGTTITLTEKAPEASCSITVTGETETTWTYDIIVKQADGQRLPDAVSLTLVQDNVSIAFPLELKETQQVGPGYAYRAQKVQTVLPGTHSAQYSIYFTADYDQLTDTVEMENVQVLVHATQID